MLPSRKFSPIALAVAGLLAAMFVLLAPSVRSPWQLHFLSDVVQAAVLLWATACSYFVARRSSGYLRQLWNLWAASLGLLTAAAFMVVYLASIRANPAATPWPSDILNFLWVAPTAMMFFPWPSEEPGRIKWQYTLDFTQVCIVAVTAYLYFFYVPSLWEAQGPEMFNRLREVAVARDVLFAVFCGLRAVTLTRSAARTFFGRLSALFVAVAVFDYIGMSEFGKFERAAEWTGMLWSVPYLLATVFAATWDPAQDRDLETPHARGGGWTSYQLLPVAIPLLVVLMGPRIAREQMTIAWVTMGASFACSAARLIVTTEHQHRIAEDLRRTEQALRRSEHMFETAFRASPDAISISLFPEGNVVEVNESYTQLTGYSREEVLGRTPQELGLWSDREHMMFLRNRFLEQGGLREEEFQFRRKDGQLRFARMSATTITLDGRLCSLVIVGDITESKQALDAVRVTEERFRSLVRDLQVGVALVRPDGAIQFANPANREMFGWKQEEDFLGKTVAELGLTALNEDGTEMSLSARPVMRAVATRQPVRGVVMGWRRPGNDDVLWIIGNAVPMLTPEGEVDYVIASFADITDLRKTQEALRSSEQRFRSLVQVLRVGISTWGPDGRCQFVNQALLEMFHVTEEQVVGRKSHEVSRALHEDGAEISPEMRPAARVLQTRQPIRNQVIGWPFPGSKEVVWTLVDAVPEFGPDGQFVRVIASLTNITDLKRAEEEKRISEEMFTKAFHASPDSMTISTLADGRYLEVNEGYTRMFGWSREEVIGKTVSQLGIWPNLADRERLRKALLDQGPVSRIEVLLRNKMGQLRTIEFSADVIELKGQPCMLAVSDDITEWKQAQEALRFSEERFRTLVENLAVGVILCGPEGEVQFANPAAEKTFGMRLEEGLGKKAWEVELIFLDEYGKELPDDMHPVVRVMATREPIQGLVGGCRRPGTPEVVWVYGNVVPQFSPEGKIAMVIASFADITDQKRAEEALRQLSTRLLQLQDEERRRLGRDLHDSLAQSVLAVNLSLAQVAQTQPQLDDRNRKVLSEARGMLQDMSRQIRTLSYLLHPPLLDELGLASAVKEYAEGFSERSGIQLEVGVSPGFGRLPQETETALFRIVQESLANIQRHSGSRTARIRLDGQPSRILLEVTDQGHGIPEALGKKRKEPDARFGVGIVGMRERMAQLGGTLEIESSKSGTTVRATLPLKAEVLHAASHPRGR